MSLISSPLWNKTKNASCYMSVATTTYKYKKILAIVRFFEPFILKNSHFRSLKGHNNVIFLPF